MAQRIYTVSLYCARVGPRLDEDALRGLLAQLPPDGVAVFHRYHRWQDRQLYLFGRLLLKKGMKDLGFTEDVFRLIQFNAYRKPYFEKLPASFSISHSTNLVACAIGLGVEVGLDVEKHEPIDIGEFKSVFPDDEWIYMHRQPDSLRCFYDFWTAKEAAIKANGKGWYVKPTNVRITPLGTKVEEQEWLTRDLPFFNGYSACIATNRPIGSLPRPQLIDFSPSATRPRVSNHEINPSNSLILNTPYFDTTV